MQLWIGFQSCPGLATSGKGQTGVAIAQAVIFVFFSLNSDGIGLRTKSLKQAAVQFPVHRHLASLHKVAQYGVVLLSISRKGPGPLKRTTHVVNLPYVPQQHLGTTTTTEDTQVLRRCHEDNVSVQRSHLHLFGLTLLTGDAGARTSTLSVWLSGCLSPAASAPECLASAFPSKSPASRWPGLYRTFLHLG